MEPEVLDTHVLHQHGSFMYIRRWLRGVHPNLGVIVWGLTGWETMVEQAVLRPTVTFRVDE